MFQPIEDKLTQRLSPDLGGQFGSLNFNPLYSDVSICWIPYGPNSKEIKDCNDLEGIERAGKIVVQGYQDKLVIYLGSSKFAHKSIVHFGNKLFDEQLMLNDQKNYGGAFYLLDRSGAKFEITGESIGYGKLKEDIIPDVLRALNSLLKF